MEITPREKRRLAFSRVELVAVAVAVSGKLLVNNIRNVRRKLSVLFANGRTIRKLMGGAGEVQKKNSRKGKLNEKKFLHA